MHVHDFIIMFVCSYKNRKKFKLTRTCTFSRDAHQDFPKIWHLDGSNIQIDSKGILL